jgi:dTMP kinase
MRPRDDPSPRAVGIAGAVREQLRRDRSGDGALARSAGAMEQVCVRGPPAGLERRSEDSAGVGMTLELWEHSSMLVPDRVNERMAAGRLITIEGIDGAGKTTLADALQTELARRGHDARLLREPGGVAAAERVRELVKDPGLRIGARAEALLYAAARAQLVEEALEPLLSEGAWVLLDRFVDSSLAYQGAGRSLGIENVRAINQFATGGRQPDRTLLLVLEPQEGRSRSLARAEPVDRLEAEDDAFFERIAAGYLELAAQDPERIRTIDAAQPPDWVLAVALEELADLV